MQASPAPTDSKVTLLINKETHVYIYYYCVSQGRCFATQAAANAAH